MENKKCPKLDNFCYVCGHIVLKRRQLDRKNLFTEEFKTAYCHYFDETDLSGANFTPNTVCKNCYNTLIMWIHGKGGQFSFMKPVIWVEDLTGHDESRCYACINSRHGLNRKQLKTKVYLAAFTATLPVKRAADTDTPKPPSLDTVSLQAETVFTNPTNLNDADWTPDIEKNGPQPLTQIEMDYIVAKMGLSQQNSEMLTSFLKSRKLTQQNVSATSYRQRQADFQKFYSVDEANTFTYSHDIPGLVKKLGMDYIAGDWRLFIDGSVSSLKAMLLHKTNKKPSIPLGFSTTMKETYETLGEILEKINYNVHKWKICCDLKVVNIIQGIVLKGGFPKYFCFLCNWDSRYTGNQYQCKDWKARTPELEKQLKLRNKPLTKDLHDGPDIRKLMKSGSFTNMLSNHYNHLCAWDALKQVIEGVLGKNRVQRDDIQTRVDNLLYYFEKINASMTLKLHFLHFHLDTFLAQLPQESDEQGERFHQVTMPMEKRFKGKKLDALLAEVCWWSSKIVQFEDESTEDEDDTEICGHTEQNMPLNIMSNSDDDADSEHEYEQPTKKIRSSEPQASTSTRMDSDTN